MKQRKSPERTTALGEGEHNFVYEQIVKIMDNINIDNALSVLNETDLLLKIMSEEFKKEHKLIELENNIHIILMDTDLLQQVKLYTRLKAELETSVEYYGKDRGSDTRLHFNKDMEDRIMEIQEEIRTALSKIINYRLKDIIDTE